MGMRFWYDTEFLEDGRTIELVSIGVVAEDGREYYAVSSEFDPDRAIPWVRRNVLDKLPSPADRAWRSRERIRDDLLAFLTEPGEPIELWAWYAAYDHVALAQLWGAMPGLPLAIPRFTHELAQSGSARPWAIAALVLAVGTIAITAGGNIPLNNALEAAGDIDRIRDLAAVRADFETAWVRWNVARCVTSAGALGALLVAALRA